MKFAKLLALFSVAFASLGFVSCGCCTGEDPVPPLRPLPPVQDLPVQEIPVYYGK